MVRHKLRICTRKRGARDLLDIQLRYITEPVVCSNPHDQNAEIGIDPNQPKFHIAGAFPLARLLENRYLLMIYITEESLPVYLGSPTESNLCRCFRAPNIQTPNVQC